jgi:glycerol-3-phosphate dehydrogenase
MDFYSEESRNKRASEYLHRKEAQKEAMNKFISCLIGIITAMLFILLYFESVN